MSATMPWMQAVSQGASVAGKEACVIPPSVHPMASVFAEFYIAQDKQHLTKQTADCISNILHTTLPATHKVINPKKC